MMPALLLALALPAQAALPAQPQAAAPTAPAAQIELLCEPRARARVARKFSLQHALALKRLSTTAGGAEQVSQQALELSSRLTLRAIDEWRAVEGPRATAFQRRFEEYALRTEVSGGPAGSETLEASSPLAGTSVLFTWVPEEQAFGRCYDARETSEEFLARLGADMDLSALLPPGPLAPGAAWEIDPARLVSVLAPGGDLPLRFTRGAESSTWRALALGIGGPLNELLRGEIGGRARARLAEVREQDGRQLAVIALELALEATCDQREPAQSHRMRTERIDGLSVATAPTRWNWKASGELLWDLEQRGARSLTLAGPQEISSRIELVDAQGSGVSAQALELVGRLALEYELTRVEPRAAQPR